MHTLSSGRIRFGALELDLTTGELRSAPPDPDNPSPNNPSPKNKVILREQVFQVLRMLVERDGQIVTREEIKSRLWGDDTVVDFDHSINATIKTLRRALGDSADNPRYIETLARRGYRLMLPIQFLDLLGAALEKDREPSEQAVGEISESTARDREKVQRQTRPHWWRAAVGLASVVIMVGGAGYISWRHFRSAPSPKRIMLAVLPFENLTGDPSKEYLADGLTEETISQLGRLDPAQLGVIARTSVMGYKHKDERLDQIGRDLSVQYVLENSLRESGGHLRLTVQLIQVKDQSHLWSQDYDYPAKNFLNVEDEVAAAIAEEMQLRLDSRAELARSHRVSPEAFDSYLQGFYFFQRNTDKDTDTARKYFEHAIQIDPSYALAWVWLSRVRNWQVNIGAIPREEGRRLAREAIERALALDPNLAEAHIQMGRIRRQVELDWTGGDTSFQRAIALEPGNTEALRMAAASAETFGRFDEALQLDHRAIDLDPLNAEGLESLAQTEFFMGRLDEAAADSKKGLEMNPDVFPGPFQLSEIYLMQGRRHEALSEIKLLRYEPPRAFLYPIAYYALGLEKESDSALSDLIAKYHAGEAYQIAEVYAFRNQLDEAFEWLDRAYTQRDSGLMETKVDPLLKSLHKDPRYAAFLEKVNLPN